MLHDKKNFANRSISMASYVSQSQENTKKLVEEKGFFQQKQKRCLIQEAGITLQDLMRSNLKLLENTYVKTQVKFKCKRSPEGVDKKHQ